jgi:hypothetical protein
VPRWWCVHERGWGGVKKGSVRVRGGVKSGQAICGRALGVARGGCREV